MNSRELLQAVSDFYEGNPPYKFGPHWTEELANERDDAWRELHERIQAYLSSSRELRSLEEGSLAYQKMVCRQHIGWLTIYAESMRPENWLDIKDRMETQLTRLSKEFHTLCTLSSRTEGPAPTSSPNGLERYREILAEECEARGFSFASQALQNPEKFGETHWTMVALKAIRRSVEEALGAAHVPKGAPLGGEE